MSFASQAIKNRFPEWSKTKRDSSSNASILIDVVGEQLESLRENGYALKLQQKNLLSEPFFEEEKMFKFNLLNDSEYSLMLSRKEIDFFELTNNEGTNIPVETVWNEYCFSYPDSITQVREEEVFLLNLEENYNEEKILKNPKQLYIILESVEGFEEISGVDPSITIRGLDFLNREIEEYIEIKDLNSYKTKNYFKRIKSLTRSNQYLNRPESRGGPAIEISGLILNQDSIVRITTHAFGLSSQKIMSQVSVADFDPFVETVYTNKSEIKNELFIKFLKGETESFYEVIHKFIREEKSILNKSSKIEKDFFEEVLFRGELRNSQEDPLVAQDWAIDRKRNELVVLDENNNLLYYSLKNPIPKRSNLVEESKDIDIVIETSSSKVLKNEEFNVNFQLERPKGPISEFYIFKTLSSENNEEFYFLNKDKEWQLDVVSFEGNDFENRFENIVPGLYVTDSLEDYGQVDYYVFSARKKIRYSTTEEFINKVNALILKDEEGYYTSRSSVIASKVSPKYSLETGLTGSDNQITIDGVSNLIYVKDSSQRTFSYKELKDRAYFSRESNCLYIKRRYSGALNFIVSFDDNTNFTTELIYADN